MCTTLGLTLPVIASKTKIWLILVSKPQFIQIYSCVKSVCRIEFRLHLIAPEIEPLVDLYLYRRELNGYLKQPGCVYQRR